MIYHKNAFEQKIDHFYEVKVCKSSPKIPLPQIFPNPNPIPFASFRLLPRLSAPIFKNVIKNAPKMSPNPPPGPPQPLPPLHNPKPPLRLQRVGLHAG